MVHTLTPFSASNLSTALAGKYTFVAQWKCLIVISRRWKAQLGEVKLDEEWKRCGRTFAIWEIIASSSSCAGTGCNKSINRK